MLFRRNKKNKRKTESTAGDVIRFALEQEQEGNIVIGKRKGEIFICFRCIEMKYFCEDWFGMLKLHRNNEISKEAYDNFVETAIKQSYEL